MPQSYIRRIPMKTFVFVLALALCTSSMAQTPQIGKFDAAGKLTSPASRTMRLTVGNFVAYFMDTHDLTLGLSLGLSRDSYSVYPTVDAAPHHLGLGLTKPVIPIVGIGVGANLTYNFETKRWEPGIVFRLKRW